MKKNALLIAAALVAAYLLIKKKGGTGIMSDVLGLSESGAAAVVTTPTAASGKPLGGAVVQAQPMSQLLKLVQTGGTSSPSSIAAQRAASSAGQAYSGVSGGVPYTVSAPHAPSARQAAAIKAAGY
jgi:hypothetical protein